MTRRDGPARFSTLVFLIPARRFSSEDLPTFGYPTTCSLRVEGQGLRVEGIGRRGFDLRLGVLGWGSGFRAQGSGLRVRVQG